jgi:dCMP deaminase
MIEKFQNFFMKTAFLLAEHSHCVSFHVGAVIVRDSRIISMGYNGTPPGTKNCDDQFDCRKFDREDHTKWSNQNEIHAEMNALAFAAKNGLEIDGSDMYVTISPCNHCLKNIVMAGIKNVYYYSKYDKSDLSPGITEKINLIHFVNEDLKSFIEGNKLLYNY